MATSVKIVFVVSVSSEQPGHPAHHVLTPDPRKVWKADPGTKAVLILQLERAVQIESMNFGNAYSSFVTVFAGSSTAQLEEFAELLPPTELMSPVDAKAGVNRHQVTMVGPEKLTAAGAHKRVDRVKIELTQPFASREPHGLLLNNPKALGSFPANSAALSIT